MTYTIDFTNKVVVVLGGAVGIGAAIVSAFSAAGADLAFSHYREDAQFMADEVRAGRHRCLSREVDARDVTQIETFIDEAVRDFGRIDALVYNAGLTDPQPLFTLTEEQWDQTLDINLKGMFFCVRRAARHIIAREDSAAIVLLSSVHSIQTYPGHTHYASSKGGINTLTRSLACDLAPHGIRVNAVAPGVIYTERARAESLYDPDDMRSVIPLGRVGHPTDIADIAVYLASDRASYITGQVVFADGGLALPLRLGT